MRARIVAISDPKAIYKYPNKINMLIINSILILKNPFNLRVQQPLTLVRRK